MKKYIYLVVVCCFLITLVTISSNAFAGYSVGNDYPEEYRLADADSLWDRWNFANRECTSFVAWCLNSRNKVNFTNQYAGLGAWGHAGDWYYSAQTESARNAGVVVDNTPAVGAIACWVGGTYGHVAWVKEVNGNEITIEEYNAATADNGWTNHIFGTRVISASDPTGYIHIKDIDRLPPVFIPHVNSPSVQFVDVSSDGFTVTCEVMDDRGISKVYAKVIAIEHGEEVRSTIVPGQYDSSTLKATFRVNIDETIAYYADRYKVICYAEDEAENGTEFPEEGAYLSLYRIDTHDSGTYRAVNDASVRIWPKNEANGFDTYAYSLTSGQTINNVWGSYTEKGKKWLRFGDYQWVADEDMQFIDRSTDLACLVEDFINRLIYIIDGTPAYATDNPDDPIVVGGTSKSWVYQPGSVTSNIASGVWGTCNWEINDRGVLTIHEGTGADTWNGVPWSEYSKHILSVVARERIVLPSYSSSLFSIGWIEAPYHASVCYSMDLSGLDTSAVTDMSYMFDGCTALTSLDLSNFDTSSVMYMRAMFQGCYNLKSLNISGFDTKKVRNFDAMFSNCYELTSIDLSSFNTSKANRMYAFFSGCKSLTSIDVSGFNTSSVTSMMGMFDDCSGLTTLDVSNFDTSNVTDMDGMFIRCSNLTEIVGLNHFNTSNVTRMSSMFSGCTRLLSVDLSSFDTSKTTNMSDMFCSCESLTNLNVSFFNTSNVVRMQYMFYGCSNIGSLDLSSFDCSSLEYSDFMFNGCTSLQSVSFPSNFSKLGYGIMASCTSLQSVTIPETVTIIEDAAFSNCEQLNTIILPDNLESIGRSAFVNCGLTTISIPNKISEIKEQAFSGCTKLKTIIISSNLTHVFSNAFEQCTSLSDVYYLGSEESWENIQFENGNSLFTEATIHFLGDTVAHGTCGDSITWSLDNDGMLTISGTGAMQGDHAWSYGWEEYRNQIYSIEIENGITSIGDWAFWSERNLTNVTLATSVTTIGNYAFDCCYSLPSIQMPDTVTSIGDCAFRYCRALTTVNLPRNLISIGDFAFMFCPDAVVSIPAGTQMNQHIRVYEGSLCILSLPTTINEIGMGAFLCTNIPVKLNISPDFSLPDSLHTIESEAFVGISATFIYIPENRNGKTTIGDRAFANCSQLQYVWISDCSEIEIASTAFSGCNSNLVIIDDAESVGDTIYEYAVDHGIDWIRNEYYAGDG